MAELKDVMVYLLQNYPHKNEMSKARLTKMVYLSDWKSAIEHARQITNIEWYFDHYGPFVRDIENTASKDSAFKRTEGTNYFGDSREVIELMDSEYVPILTAAEKDILDIVIKSTSPKYWDGFIKLVYSTYPIRTQERYSYLNLVELAKDYAKEKASLAEECTAVACS